MADVVPTSSSAKPQTRFQRARQDTNPFVVRRELAGLIVGGILGVILLLIFVSGESAADELFVVGGAAIGTAVLVPAMAFGWNYWQAPHRMVLDEVRALRQEVAQLTQAKAARQPEKRPNVRLTLLNSVRKGDEIAEKLRYVGLWSGTAAEADAWTDRVTQFLSKWVSAEASERFLTAGESASELRTRLFARVRMLKEIVEELPD